MIVGPYFIFSDICCILHLSTIHYDLNHYTMQAHFYIIMVYAHIVAAVWGIAPIAFVINQVNKCYNGLSPNCSITTLSSDVPMSGCLNFSTTSEGVAISVLVFIIITYVINLLQTVLVLRLHNSVNKNS